MTSMPAPAAASGDVIAAEAERPSPIDEACLAVVVVRDGRLPGGADEAVAQADGAVLLVGGAADAAVKRLTGARRVWVLPSGTSPRSLCRAVAPLVRGVSLLVLPASPDGRDLAPLLAHNLGWPLLSGSVVACHDPAEGTVRAELLRIDGRVVVPAVAKAPAVVTVWSERRPSKRADVSVDRGGVSIVELTVRAPLSAGDAPRPASAGEVADLEVLETVPPEPSTMDLADATRVFAGGAGLVSREARDSDARAVFTLLGDVAEALGAAAGATRVISDAGWVGHDRQIGTTGVSVDPDLYVAFGISGATQHTGGIGDANHVVSVNVDPSAPMARMANLAIVADAPEVLGELARRLGVATELGVGVGGLGGAGATNEGGR